MGRYEKRVVEERRKKFQEMYKKMFGVECQLEELDSLDKTILEINIWGIKSPWI